MSQSVSTLLDQLQSELEHAGMWQTVPPAAEKMMSVEPFSIDTLSFVEWLQWIYIARLRAIIEANGKLPQGAQVAPYAEEAFRVAGIKAPSIVLLIEALDQQLQ